MNKSELYKIIINLKKQVIKIREYNKNNNYEMVDNELSNMSIMLSATLYKIEEE